MWIPGKSDSLLWDENGAVRQRGIPNALEVLFLFVEWYFGFDSLGNHNILPRNTSHRPVGVPALKELTMWLRRWASECLGRKWYDWVSAWEHGKGKGFWASQGEGTCDKYTREAAEGGSSKREVAGGRALEVEKTFTSV